MPNTQIVAISCIADMSAAARPTTSVVAIRAANIQKRKPKADVKMAVLISDRAIDTTTRPPGGGPLPRFVLIASHRARSFGVVSLWRPPSLLRIKFHQPTEKLKLLVAARPGSAQKVAA